MNEIPSNTSDFDNNNVEIKDKSATTKIDDDNKFFSSLEKLQNLKVPTNDDLQEHERVLQSILNYANRVFESSTYSDIINCMLPTLLNYSNKTVLVPCLIKTDYPSTLLKWLNFVSKNQERSDDVIYVVGVIYNISRHDNGIQVLNSLNTTDRIKEFQIRNTDPVINIMCSMILALLSTSEQIKNDRKRMNNILDQLLQIVVDTSKQSHNDLAGGWHISEPLIVLVRLICYDRTLDYILQHAQVELETTSTAEFFIKILLKFHKEVSADDPLKLSTCTALCNILWSISLRPQYKQELQENEEFKMLIEKIATEEVATNSAQYVPKYIENIQKAAEGILCNINNTNQVNSASVAESERRTYAVSALASPTLTNSKPSIMISYAHSDNNICMQLYNELVKHNQQFDIWIDWKNSKTGYLWGKIADGIADSSVILCLLSNKYYESKSCQQEFIYAHDHLKKPIIPVYILDDKPPGWLAIHTCIMKYVRFRNINQLELEKLKDLIEMIEENLSGTSAKAKDDLLPPISMPVHHKVLPVAQKSNEEGKSVKSNVSNEETNSRPKTDLSRKPVEQWVKSDIKQWFEENKLSMDLCKLYQFEDGGQLLTYAASLSNEEKIELQRQMYSDEFAEVYKGKRLLPHQFTTFAHALRKLSSEQVKTGTKQIVNHPATQKSAEANKSQTCEIL